MLDIRFVREHHDTVRKDLEKRRAHDKIELLDELLQLDSKWRSLKGETDQLRSERNKISEEINKAKKEGKNAEDLIKKAKEVPVKIAHSENRMKEFDDRIRRILLRLPNLMHESVPYGKDDSENKVVATFGKKPHFSFEPKNHTELIEQLNVVELERAAKIAGSRFYFLQGDLALLEHGLQSYALRFMASKGYTPVQPPHMMSREAYEGVTDLADFADVLYKVEDEDLYLIATSEHPLTAQFQGEVIDAASLPIKLVGVSPCYRKETGSHGKEEKGIWRVHHFNKVEQVVLCAPEESWSLHEEIIANAIAFFESLELHFRQVLICTGDLGIVAAKKYDLEAWIPSVGQYKEVVSASNCTSYQAVRLGIRYREGSEHAWVHTLNSTCCATSRALVAILEQRQQADGSIAIPEALRQYMGGKDRIEPAQKIRTI
jgi:seryl-tRNA synthetase